MIKSVIKLYFITNMAIKEGESEYNGNTFMITIDALWLMCCVGNECRLKFSCKSNFVLFVAGSLVIGEFFVPYWVSSLGDSNSDRFLMKILNFVSDSKINLNNSQK